MRGGHLADEGAEGDDGAEAVLVALQNLDVVDFERLLHRGAGAGFGALLIDEVWQGGRVSVGAALQVRRTQVVAIDALKYKEILGYARLVVTDSGMKPGRRSAAARPTPKS